MEFLKTFQVVEIFGELLENNLTDLNPQRKNPNWISYAYQDDEMEYPKVILENENIDFKDVSAGNVLMEIKEGTIYKRIYAKHAVSNLKIYIFTNKKNETLVNVNGKTRYLRDKLTNIYLRDQIKSVILENLKHLDQYFGTIKLNNVTGTYDNDKETIFSVIDFSISYNDTWVEIFGNGKLLKSYSLGIMLDI